MKKSVRRSAIAGAIIGGIVGLALPPGIGLVLGAAVGAVVGIPIYYLFSKNLLELSSHEPTLFIIENIDDNGNFVMKTEWAVKGKNKELQVSGKRLKAKDRGVSMIAKYGPNYQEYLQVYLRIQEPGWGKWLSAGERSTFRNGKIKLLNHKMTAWRLIRSND